MRIIDWSSDVCSSDLLFDEIFEDRPRLRDDAVVGIGIDDHRRLAERVNAGERRRSEHRLRIAFVAADLIRQIEFLEQPQHPLRARIFEMVDDDRHWPRTALIANRITPLRMPTSPA